MQFQEREDHTEALERMQAAFASAKRGDVLPYAQLEAMAGASRKEPDGDYRIGKFRRWLENDKGIVTWCIPNVGVRLLTDAEQAIDEPHKAQRRSYRQLNRSCRRTRHVEADRLSLHQRRAMFATVQAMRYERLLIGRSNRELGETVRGTETLPKRNRKIA